MSGDRDLDDFVRSSLAQGAPDAERVRRLVASTLDSLPEPRRRLAWVWQWPDLLVRFAVPMATAAVLGVFAGGYLSSQAESVQFLSSTTIFAGF